jgi:hypothetical protein
MNRPADTTTCQLSHLRKLDERLSRLKREGIPSMELWQAFEDIPLAPSLSDSREDRRCWWQHLYAILERHGLAVARGMPSEGQCEMK